MKYYAQFDASGVMNSAIAEEYITSANEYLQLGYAEITSEEMKKYLGKNYIRGKDGQPIEKPLEIWQREKLEEVEIWTKQAIIGGFTSTAKGAPYIYDSEDGDQATFAALYNASRSPEFETTPPYNGQIPIRAKPEGEAAKVKLLHNAAEMQQLINDLALHLGMCKEKGWALQEKVNKATTKEALSLIEWGELS